MTTGARRTVVHMSTPKVTEVRRLSPHQRDEQASEAHARQVEMVKASLVARPGSTGGERTRSER